MKENMLPKKTLLLWKIRVACVALICISVCLFLCFASIWFLTVSVILFVICIVLIFWYLPQYFKSYEILFDKGVIVINRGVFIKTSHIMPFSRMVYAQSFSTPLAKLFGLSAICLKAARSNLFIPEIEETEANNFIEVISKEDVI